MNVENYKRDQKVVHQIDGHWCNDWDGLAVSAWTMEYDGCVDFPKSRLGRIINWFCVQRFNLGWWWHVGRKRNRAARDFDNWL